MAFRKILSNLNSLPIFKMSLGSKELFHSNFLEYLWSLDNKRFINLINDLFGSQVLNNSTTYELSREKENFDICIYHKVNKKKIIYDVIIENKVKSIPNKEQLDNYVKKVQSHKQTANYLLLSLLNSFPDRDDVDINRQKGGLWKIVNYQDLHTAISKHYQALSTKDDIYIDDYLAFIQLMQQLEVVTIPSNFINNNLWPNYNDYKIYRLHDLYIKLRGQEFLRLLKQKLQTKGITSDIVSIAGDKLRAWYNNNPNAPKHQVYLNWNVFNAVGQIAAFIYRGGNEIYEIVIQGPQYRHGINYYDANNLQLKTWIQNKNAQAISAIWSIVGKNNFMKEYYWNQQLQQFNTKYKKGAYCQYKPDYVYRYWDISKEKIDDLLNGMVEDIDYTLNNVKP